jgi:hypothetical protein
MRSTRVVEGRGGDTSPSSGAIHIVAGVEVGERREPAILGNSGNGHRSRRSIEVAQGGDFDGTGVLADED